MSEDFFKHRREWSRWKHHLLKRYLGQFAGIVGSTHREVYYVDGFAGEGRYKDPPEDGSPVIAAKLAVDDSVARNYTLHCINIEPDRYDALCDSTNEFPPSVVTNLRGTFREHLDKVEAKTGLNPTLFFLDPMGHVGMEWDVVQRLADRASVAITDVLLNFYVTRIDMHAGFLRSTEPPANAFVQRLNALFGTEEWQQIWIRAENQDERFRLLTDLYMTRLVEAFAASSPDSVAARYPVRTIEGDLKYFIIFGTRHPRGGRAMSDAVFRVSFEYDKARVDARNAEMTAIGHTSSLFGLEPVPTRDEIDPKIVAELATDIRSLAPLNKSMSLDDLENLLLPRWFGRAIRTHYLQACVSIVQAGYATVPPRTGRRKVMTASDKIALIRR